MVKRFAEKIRASPVWNKEFENWDDILDNGILKCSEISVDDKLAMSIIRTGELLKEIMSHKLSNDFNLSIPQLNILECLFYSRREYLTQEELSKMVFCSKANVSGMISRMEEKKLIIRELNDENHREKKIILTILGKELLLKVFDSFENCSRKMPSFFSNTDSHQIVENMKKMRQQIRSYHS